MDTYSLPQHYFTRPLNVVLIGVGGNGCEMLRSLVDIHKSLLALGHPGGLKVTVYDGDTVSETNLLRQSFWEADLNKNKASVLVHRYNVFAGLNWTAIEAHFNLDDASVFNTDIVITCTDSGAFRYSLGEEYLDTNGYSLWLDMGNARNTGQVVLGHLSGEPDIPLRLPNVYDLFGLSLLDGDKSKVPTCSAEAALGQQNLFVNRTLTNHASAVLWGLLQNGSINNHGLFMDLDKQSVSPLAIHKDTWQVFGYKTVEESDCSPP